MVIGVRVYHAHGAEPNQYPGTLFKLLLPGKSRKVYPQLLLS